MGDCGKAANSAGVRWRWSTVSVRHGKEWDRRVIWVNNDRTGTKDKIRRTVVSARMWKWQTGMWTVTAQQQLACEKRRSSHRSSGTVG